MSNTRKDGDEVAFSALGLRPATAEDQPFLRDLFASTRSDELAILIWDQNRADAFIAMQFNAQSRQYGLSYPYAYSSIIMWNEASIGRLLIDKGEHEFTLVDIALLPSHRGGGIGTHLLQDLLREAASAGKPVKLNVWNSNPAKRLYQRMGFSASTDDGMYCEMWWNRGL